MLDWLSQNNIVGPSYGMCISTSKFRNHTISLAPYAKVWYFALVVDIAIVG